MTRLRRRQLPTPPRPGAASTRTVPVGEVELGRLVGHVGSDDADFEGVIDPVDPNLFSFLSGIYSSAACMAAPLEVGAAGLADSKASRGLLAVKRELMELKVRDQLPYFWRLMHFPDVLRARERLGTLITDDEGGGALQIAEAVMHAAATARFVVEGQRAYFDLDDLVRRAQQYAGGQPPA